MEKVNFLYFYLNSKIFVEPSLYINSAFFSEISFIDVKPSYSLIKLFNFFLFFFITPNAYDAKNVKKNWKEGTPDLMQDLSDQCGGDINFIIGNGVGLFNNDPWSGNLNNVDGCSGYWVNSSAGCDWTFEIEPYDDCQVCGIINGNNLISFYGNDNSTIPALGGDDYSNNFNFKQFSLKNVKIVASKSKWNPSSVQFFLEQFDEYIIISGSKGNIFYINKEFINDFGYPPTIRDIQNNCDISSTSVVKYNLDRLQEKGLMTRESEVSRGINLKSDTKNPIIKVPVIGTITAGEPFPLFDDNRWEYDDIDMLELPDKFSHLEEKLYALKVSGTSMIDALIGDGDTVVMEKTKSVNNGDMVAANVISENETTLKRIYKEGENIRLQPENPLMKALIYPSKNISILGRVVAVWRNLNK